MKGFPIIQITPNQLLLSFGTLFTKNMDFKCVIA